MPVKRITAGRVSSLLCGLLVLGACSVVLAQAYPKDLRYGPRGDRSEGLQGEPKGADAIVLVSAVADVQPHDTLAEWPEMLRLRFFLPKEPPPMTAAPASTDLRPLVRVRQLRSLTGYYILDSVAPTTPWTFGTVNDFSWKRNIVQKVYEYQVPEPQRKDITKSGWLAGLGVVVSLGGGGSLRSMTVAPAALEHTNRAVEVSKYLFTFRSTAPAVVTGAITSSTNQTILSGLKFTVVPGSPFTVAWPVTNQPDGWYRLKLDATLPGDPEVNVRFYHKKVLPSAK